MLKLRCKREKSGNFAYTSGEITTSGKVTFYKGRIEIRAKLNYARGFDALFTKLNSMKDDNIILFIQGWDRNSWHYLCQRAATELDAKFMKIGERNGAWPNYQSAYATANVSATTAVPANLSIPYKNLPGLT